MGFSQPFIEYMKDKFGGVDNSFSMLDIRNIIYKKCEFGFIEREKYLKTLYKCHHLAVGESILWRRHTDMGRTVKIVKILLNKEKEARADGVERFYDFINHDAEYYRVTRMK